MADTTPTTAGEEPQLGTQTPVGNGGEQPLTESHEPFDATKAIDSMSEADLQKALFGGSTQAEPEAPPARNEPQEPAGTATPVEQASKPDGEEPPTADTSADDAQTREPSAQGPDRISLRTLPPQERALVAQAVSLFRDGKVASVADALKQLIQSGENGAPQEQQPPQAAASQQQAQPEPKADTKPTQAPVTVDPDVTRITAVLADLREQRAEAVRSYDREKEIDLTRTIEDTVGELSEARASARIREQQQATKNALVKSAVEETYLKYPDSEDPDSFFSFRLSRELDAYEARYGAISENPAQLLVLAEKVATALRTAPKGTAEPAPVIQQPAPKQEARPLGLGAPGHAAPPRPSREQTLKQIEAASEDDLRTALWG